MKSGKYKILNFSNFEIEVTKDKVTFLDPDESDTCLRGEVSDTILEGVFKSTMFLKEDDDGEELTLTPDPVKLVTYPAISRYRFDEDGLYYSPSFGLLIFSNYDDYWEERYYYLISKSGEFVCYSSSLLDVILQSGVCRLVGDQETELLEELSEKSDHIHKIDVDRSRAALDLLQYKDYFESDKDRVSFCVTLRSENVPLDKIVLPELSEINPICGDISIDYISEYNPYEKILTGI